MKTRRIFGVVGLAAGVTLAVILMLASGGSTGQYHVGGTLLCYDCHTIHFSMQHGWDSGNPVQIWSPGTPIPPGGSWLGATGPNTFLLKAPANDLCLACHDGQTFAPDVLETDTNTGSTTQGRQAGALNETGTSPYETWKGHTLESSPVSNAPGWNPSAVGITATSWTTGVGGGPLECVSCHLNHGIAAAYRNLGPRSIGGGSANYSKFQPTYVINTANDPNVDVWINLAGYTAGSSNSATFGPYYDTANIFYNRDDTLQVGTQFSSNRMGSLCSACHANFHGGPTNPNIGGTGSPATQFVRHPTARVTIGAVGGGHSNLGGYTGAVNKVKVNSDAQAPLYTDASPSCISCHKGHGNQNPFGLIFMDPTGGTVTEQGTGAGPVPPATGIRDLCGQCHVQGD